MFAKTAHLLLKLAGIGALVLIGGVAFGFSASNTVPESGLSLSEQNLLLSQLLPDECQSQSPIQLITGSGVFNGTADNDLLLGSASYDEIRATQGDDCVVGGDANDWLRGGGQADVILGQEGNDRLDGQGGRDTLYGGPGNDDLRGGGGRDTLYGDEGTDSLDGGNGTDTCFGDTATDTFINCETIIDQ